MFSRVLRFVRLPLVLLVVWAALRFIIGLRGVPYAPRGNAMFSVLGLAIISCLYFGAMSRRVGGFDWGGTVLVGAVLGLWTQILIFIATLISFAADLNTYFVHWDALNIPEGTHVPMARGMTTRAVGLVVGTILGIIMALIGRAVFSALAPRCDDERR
jgi:hypothetical protein